MGLVSPSLVSSMGWIVTTRVAHKLWKFGTDSGQSLRSEFGSDELEGQQGSGNKESNYLDGYGLYHWIYIISSLFP